MTKEEVRNIIDNFNQRPTMGGVSLELVKKYLKAKIENVNITFL